jgi:hypothetical protein
MASLEDRLRNELRQIGDSVENGSLRPLRTPVQRSRRGLVRWLAPVTAMAAVVAVATGLTLSRSQAPPHPHPATAITGMPPYYVTVDDVTVGQGAGHRAEEARATVHASATGRALSSVRLPTARNIPTGQLFLWEISAAADDRSFLIQQARQLLVLHISPDGRSAQLSELPVRLSPTASVALSPDGSTAAVESISSCATTSFGANNEAPACRSTEIQLISLDTGATTRTWSTTALAAQSTWISWTRASQILFLWPGATAGSTQPGSLRLLDLGAPGSNLLAARVLPVQVGSGPPFPPPYAFLTPDGSTVIFSPSLSDGSAATMPAASARTGRLLYTLGQAVGADAPDCNVLSLGPAGLHALVRCDNPAVFLGRVDNGRFTRLPGLTDPWGVAAW